MDQSSPKVAAPFRLATVLAIHAEMMRRLADDGQLTLAQWSEIMEDAGNRYLDIADCIRQTIIAARLSASPEYRQLSSQTSTQSRASRARQE